MQVLQERGETGSRHGRATFAVLLLQVCIRQPYKVHIHTGHAVTIRHSLSLVALARSCKIFLLYHPNLARPRAMLSCRLFWALPTVARLAELEIGA